MTSESRKHRANPTTGETIREIVVLLVIIFLVRTFLFGLYQVPTGSMETTMLVGDRFFGDKITMWLSKPNRGDIIAFNDQSFEYSSNPAMRLFQEYVWGPINLTKRIVGLPGDRIRGVIENGKPVIYINDNRLDEPYLNKYPLLIVWKSNGEIATRSYDPAVSYEQQPFYTIDAESVVHVKPGSQDPNYTITEDGRLLEEPGVPIVPSHHHITRHGNNFWGDSDEFYVELGPDQYWVMGDNRRGSKDSRFFGPIDGRLIHARIRYRLWSLDSEESWWILDLLKHPIDFWSRVRWNRFFQVLH
jgi:signal peptidase I